MKQVETVRGNLHDFGGGTVLLEENWYRGNGAGNRGFSELWLQDATWTRFREITLSYSFNQDLLKVLKLSQFKYWCYRKKPVLMDKSRGKRS